MLFTANDWVLLYDSPHDLVFPLHIVQTSHLPENVICSNATKQVIILKLAVPAEERLVQQHSAKEFKYTELLDNVSVNHWTGHIFGLEVGNRSCVAKSFGFSLQKVGLEQNAILEFRKALSLIYIRCSYSIYL